MDYSVEAIRGRLISRLQYPVNKIEGSFAFDVMGAVAVELSNTVTEKVDTIIDSVSVDTAIGIDLDRKALEFAPKRNEATRARGVVKITGNTNSIIYKNTVLISKQNIEFVVLNDTVIDGTGEAFVSVECLSEGTTGNIDVGQITAFKEDLEGIKSVVNEMPFSGGTNREKDEAFRTRLMDSRRKPRSSGNEHDYEYWAKEVSGISFAKPIPLADGNGTVKLIVLSDEYEIVGAELLKKVKEHIESKRPVGARVSVVSARAKPLIIDMRLVIASGNDAETIKQRIMSEVKAYLRTIAFDENKPFSYYRVGQIVFGIDGVKDIIDYTINGGKTSVELNNDEFFQLNGVTINGVE